MFNKRKDATQINFEKFLKQMESGVDLYGYYADGAQILTNDIELIRTLLETEKERSKNRAAETKDEPYTISVLETFGYGLSKDANAKSWFKNSIYAEQKSCVDGWTGRDIGGGMTIVLTETPERLKEFVQPIVNRHIDEFKIPLERGNSFYADVNVPYLEINFSVDNKADQLATNLFTTRTEMKNCAQTVLAEIDKMKVKKNTGEKED